MNGIFLQVIQSAKRDKLFLGSTVFTAVATCFGIFMGANSLIEQKESSIVYTSGLSRNIIAICLIMFTCLFIKKMFENREIDVILSKPISRAKILTSIFLSFFVVAFFMCLPSFFIIAFLLNANLTSTILWWSTMYMECIICLGFSVMYSLIVKSTFITITGALSSYLISRIIGQFVAYSNIFLSFEGKKVFFDTLSESILKIISIIIPRLDMFSKSKWLVYDTFTISDGILCITQAVVFTGMMFFMALYDFKKKEF